MTLTAVVARSRHPAVGQSRFLSEPLHIFNRFWCTDAARREDDHAGLGLALVRTYADELGVQISAVLVGERRFVQRLEGFTAVPAKS